ncbi:hypothetical protein Ancab_037618 [Ancistrocladus abbreviatus]
MPRYDNILSPPPPLMAIGQTVGGSSSNTSSSSSSSAADNLSPSILITVLILATAVILSASLYLLLRFLNRHLSPSNTSESDALGTVHHQRHNPNHNNDYRHHQHRHSSSRRVSPEENNSLIDSLPLFTFDSINRDSSTNSTAAGGGDCAVCLSKFEPHDQLRLLPICCHAFHARCIDTWLAANQTCPLCRSPIFVSESEVMSKILMTTSSSRHNSGSFRIEIGSVSRRRLPSDSGDQQRSYSIGSFDYIVDEALSEVTVESTRRGSDYADKIDTARHEAERTVEVGPEPPGLSVATEIAGGGGGSWLKDYVDRLGITASFSLSSSFRSSGRFFTGSSRRSELNGVRDSDYESSRLGEEIGEMFRWLSGV